MWLPGDPEATGGEQANGDPLPGQGPAAARELQGHFQTTDGSLGDAEVIGPTSHCEPITMFLAAMDRDDRGDTILAWSGEDASGLNVAYRSKGAKAWSPQDGVVPDGSGPSCNSTPQVALAENGSAVITWQYYHSNPNQFQATELLARRVTITR